MQFAQCPGWPQEFALVFDHQQKEFKALHLIANLLSKPHTSLSDPHPREAEDHWGTDTGGRSLPCQPHPNLNVAQLRNILEDTQASSLHQGDPGPSRVNHPQRIQRPVTPAHFKVCWGSASDYKLGEGLPKGVIPWGWAQPYLSLPVCFSPASWGQQLD